MSDFPKRTLIATNLKHIAALKNGSNLFDVSVTDEEGNPVEGIFRAFVELDLDKAVEYEVRPYQDPVRGTTYTLLPLERQSRTAILAERVQELTERLTELENTLDARIMAVADERINGALEDMAL